MDQGAVSSLPTGVLGHARASAFTMHPSKDIWLFLVSARYE